MEISTPGRICLFGEHQDYLGLPVIAMAISLRMKIVGEKRLDTIINIDMPDIGKKEIFSLDKLDYSHSRDYFKSGIKICQKEGLKFSKGFNCKINSKIPISAGTSSSSALTVSWINFLSKMADNPVEWGQKKIGLMAYKAEVLEFNESGGMMDQYSTAVGDLIYLESTPKINIKRINSKLGSFVLGDSGESKNTMKILERCKENQKLVLKKIYTMNNKFDLFNNGYQNLDLSILNQNEKALFKGIIKNKIILKKAFVELNKNNIDHKLIGDLLLKHHSILRDVLKVSTPKIELMLDLAIRAGAVGGKINGSGGGGCMFAYAPNNTKKVVDAIRKVGAKAYIVHPDSGTIKRQED